MTPDERARRMQERLPEILQNGQKLARIFRALGQELERMEEATRRILHGRWHSLASGFGAGDELRTKATSELGRIAALFDLRPGRGEDDVYFRARLAALLRLHARGLTTAPAILELVSFVYLASQPPTIAWEGDVAVGRYQVRSADGGAREIRVHIVDNPLGPASADFPAVREGERFVVLHGGLGEAKPEISLTARTEVAVPVLIHEDSGFALIFVGRIPAGRKLTLQDGTTPLLDDKPCAEMVLGAIATRFGSAAEPKARFGTDEARFSVFHKVSRVPPLQPGENRFRYRTLTQEELRMYLPLEDRDDKNLLAKAYPEKEKKTGLVDIGFRWSSILRAAFELHIPVDYMPPHYDAPDSDVRGMPGLIRDIEAAVRYGRAAGVVARVQYTASLPGESAAVTDMLRFGAEARLGDALVTADGLAAVGLSIVLDERVEEPTDRTGPRSTFNQA